MELNGFLSRGPLVAIQRGIQPHEAGPIPVALAAHGIAIIGLPLNSPDPLESVASLVRGFGDRLLIETGTAMTAE